MTRTNEIASDDISKIVLSIIEGGGPSWFEGIACPLARARWCKLENTYALSYENYGTARHLACNPAAIRDERCRIWPPRTFGTSRSIIVEELPPEALKRYAKLGLEFYPVGSIDAPFLRQRIEAAFERIALVPGIRTAVGELLAVMHILKPPDPEYDVSYSDPGVPFSIFVSFDIYEQEHGDLRLAEAIVHECMHLLLTLLENALPLLDGEGEKYHSPWQDTLRPSRGILHGLYVFRVIHDFLTSLLKCEYSGTREREYLIQRKTTIQREIAETAGFEHSKDLTALGRQMVVYLLKSASVEAS